MARERRAVIRASEMGEYVYCARAWWLRRVAGLEPAGRERREYGVGLHHRHGRAVAGSRALLVLVWALRLRRTTGLPWAPVLYRDTGGSMPEKPLIARKLGLVGKPDYLLE